MGLAVIILSTLIFILLTFYEIKLDEYNELKLDNLYKTKRNDYLNLKNSKLMLENYRLNKLLKEHDIDLDEGIGICYGMDFIDKLIIMDS